MIKSFQKYFESNLRSKKVSVSVNSQEVNSHFNFTGELIITLTVYLSPKTNSEDYKGYFILDDSGKKCEFETQGDSISFISGNVNLHKVIINKIALEIGKFIDEG